MPCVPRIVVVMLTVGPRVSLRDYCRVIGLLTRN